MKKGAIAFAGAAAIGALASMIIAADFGLDYGDYRLAIADQSCKVEGEAGWSYQQSKCVYTESRAGYCGCFTHDNEQLTGELSVAEVETLKTTHPNWFRDVGVCEGTLEGTLGRWFMVAPYYCTADGDCPGTATCNASNRCIPDPAWTCVAIKRGIPRVLVSHRASTGPLTLAMIEKCCAGCSGGCLITPTDWDICPYCLLDGAGACDSLCE